MAQWSIGPIRGEFQPESFVETQKTKYEDIEIFGSVSLVLLKGWDPREVSLSFVVDGMCDPPEGNTLWTRATAVDRAGSLDNPVASDPEDVWAEIQRLQRLDPAAPIPLRVNIPGWGFGALSRSGRSGVLKPAKAIIIDSSINRTHIAGDPSRAVRAIITVTLREANRPLGRGFSEDSLATAEAFRSQQERLAESAQKAGEAEAQRRAGF
jgi:hypothetical protein